MRILWACLLLVPCSGFRDPDIKLKVSVDAIADRNKIELRIEADKDVASCYLYVRNEGKDKAEGVRFIAQLQERERLVQDMSITVRVRGAEERVDFAVEPGPSPRVPLVILFKNLKFIGKAIGKLIADTKAGPFHVADVEIIRLPAPTLRIVGAMEGKGLSLKQTTAKSRYRIALESTTDSKVEQLKIRPSSFTGPDGNSYEGTYRLGNQKIDKELISVVAALDVIELELETDFTVLGEYTGFIALTYDGRLYSTPIVVTRQRVSGSFEITGIAGSTGTSFFSCFLGDGPIVWISIHETTGRRLVLGLPGLKELFRKETGSSLQAGMASEIRDENGNPISSLQLDPYDTKRIQFRFLKLSGPGEYAGIISVGGRDLESIDKQVTLVVKDSWLTALLCILAGIFGSFGLRRLAADRTRLVALRRAKQDLRNIEQIERDIVNGTSEERTVYYKLLKDIQELSQVLGKRQDATELAKTQTALNAWEAKRTILPQWINLCREFEALSSSLNPTTRNDVSKTIRETGQWLSGGSPTAWTEDQLHQDTNKIREGVKVELTDRSDKIVQQIDHQIATLKGSAESYRWQVLKKEIETLKGKIGDDPQASQTAFAKLYRLHARAMIAGIRGWITQMKVLEVPGLPWEILRTKTDSELTSAASQLETDPEGATIQYETAVEHLLVTVIDATRAHLDPMRAEQDRRKADLEKRKGGLGTDEKSAQERKEIEGQIEKIASEISKLKDAMTGLDSAKTAALSPEHRYAEAFQIYQKSWMDYNQYGMAGFDAPPSVPLAGELRLMSGSRLRAWSPVQLGPDSAGPSDDRMGRELLLIELTLLVVTAIVGAFTGLGVLWRPDPVWGGIWAWVTAILWGLGVHQVGGAAFEGTTSVLDRILKAN